jgi:hypothetical protein
VQEVIYKVGRKVERGKITFVNGDVCVAPPPPPPLSSSSPPHLISSSDSCCSRSYTGEWSEGAKNGEGKYVCKSGVVYDGRWKDDTRHGFGSQPSHPHSCHTLETKPHLGSVCFLPSPAPLTACRHLLLFQRRRLQGKMAC